MHKATQYFEVQRLIRIPKQQLSNISDFGGTIALCNLLVLIYVASKKVIFDSLGYPVLTWQRVCQGVLKIF